MDSAKLKQVRKEYFRLYGGSRQGIIEWDTSKMLVALSVVTDTGTRDRHDLYGYVHDGRGGGPPADEPAILIDVTSVPAEGRDDSKPPLTFPNTFGGVKVWYTVSGGIRAAKGATGG